MELETIKRSLAAALRARRAAAKVSQTELAARLGSSQSRVAKMEAADGSVSTDLLIRGLLKLDASASEIGDALSGHPRKKARPRRAAADRTSRRAVTRRRVAEPAASTAPVAESTGTAQRPRTFGARRPRFQVVDLGGNR